MIYRNFAICTLIAAPLIVLAVQSMLPKAPEPAPTQPIIADAPPPPVIIPVAPPSAGVDAPAFGQPMAEAGKPMLAPGAGLPETTVAPTVVTGQMFSPDAAPAGSPNAE
ncbi:hypothetical protein D0Z70_13765 [Sphingobium terrigena]|uniref:Uncharacterized protein n=1 Tax=Sphingobium terrigena TaxID=2304063 RepID=A0A418YRF4_9SPHN|nr:hypothetical protein [Sphingobium terrigena]RJG54199.1 hypothetical protein D0Z70_13765 [Sphingobium terrigena]